MDFPVCPSCGQSVIDDDALDCPFCGASMKAKPGSKPAPAAAKPAATAATSAKPAGAKAASGKPTLPGDDFPFDSELTAGKSAIQAMPNPTKQRTLQIVCPMCDTTGYVPPTAAGQDVRCANPKCVMPVFTVPAPKKKEEPPPPPPAKSSNLPFLATATVVIVSAIGGGLYYINSLPGNQQASSKKEMSEEDKQLMAEMSGGGQKPVNVKPSLKTQTNNGEKKNGTGNAAIPTVEPKLAADAFIKTALKQMQDACLENKKQRSKPYCRQLTAEANALTGNLKAAREDLAQLLIVGNEVTYYRISPLLEVFWADFAAGNKKALAESLNLAMTELPKIPKFGRTRLEIAGRLAAAMAAAGQMDEPLKMLKDSHSDDSDAQLAARLQIATDGRVARLSDWYSVLPWKFPQAVAATASLMARGESETAAAWASGQTDEDAKAECLAFWAEDIAFRKAEAGTADANGTIEAAVNSLPAALAARVWARAGCGRWLAKDRTGVAAAIQRAQEKLGEVAAPAECAMPIFKATDSLNLPDEGPLLRAATAASEIAFLQAQSAATKPDAEKSLDTALSFVDATAPSYAAAQTRQIEADRLGSKGLRDRLKTELKKRTDDEARLAANSFRRKLDEILKASQRRFDIETQMLSRLRGAGVGLDTKVWIIVNARTTDDDVDHQDNFMATELPGALVEGLKGTVESQAILAAWRTQFKTATPPRPPSVVFNELLQTNVSAAVEFALTVETKSNRREELLLQASSQLPTVNKLPIAFQFIAKLDDVVTREDCYLLAAAQGARRGQAELVSKQVANVTQQTEKVAICRGLIAGLQSVERRNSDLPGP